MIFLPLSLKLNLQNQFSHDLGLQISAPFLLNFVQNFRNSIIKAWTFEALPQLRPKDYLKERTLPRMKRWLFEKVEKDRPDPFQIKDDPAWTFEALPQLRPNDYPKERTLPRMKRWLFEKVEKDRLDPFQIKDDPVVCPFLYPTKAEKREAYIQNLIILPDKET
nr:uncharacterized protein LOC104099738 isoform X1 [Nicotiana tomentosiformis]